MSRNPSKQTNQNADSVSRRSAGSLKAREDDVCAENWLLTQLNAAEQPRPRPEQMTTPAGVLLPGSGKIADQTLVEGLVSVIRGLRNGVTYGARVRFPHALVMTFLFKGHLPLRFALLLLLVFLIFERLTDKFRFILRATFEHSKNLGSYVALFKLALFFCRKLRGGVEGPLNHAIAGAVGGAIMFGRKTPVVHQINLYVFSRISLGLTRLVAEKANLPVNGDLAYLVFGSLTWAIVMWLFEFHSSKLAGSLRSSMTYLYHNEKPPPGIAVRSILEWFHH